MTELKIATRNSPLALWQATHIKTLLQRHYPDLSIHLLPLVTVGDKQLESSLADKGGKGLFIKELEWALLDGRADIAVHSMKDMPLDMPAGLCLGACSQREDPRDAFLSLDSQSLVELPIGAKIGTSSLRRQSQLLLMRPDLTIECLRGNVNTRIKQLEAGKFDAIILAAAGLKRLNLSYSIRSYFNLGEMLPAVGQGIIGVQCREGDQQVLALLSPLNDVEASLCLQAERAMNRALGGNCASPIAGFAEISGESLSLQGAVFEPQGKAFLRLSAQGGLNQADQLGQSLGNELVAKGARQWLGHVK